MLKLFAVLALALHAAGCAMTPNRPASADARSEVMAAERAFARTMAARDLEAFTAFVSEEAVFFSAATPLRGRAQVRAGWAGYFSGPQAPFSWEPDEVEVLPSGTLALSSGPVRNPGGTVVARFTSIWRLEAPGTWRVVFDKGSPVRQGSR